MSAVSTISAVSAKCKKFRLVVIVASLSLLCSCLKISEKHSFSYLAMSTLPSVKLKQLNITSQLTPSSVPNEDWVCGLHALALTAQALSDKPIDGNSLIESAHRNFRIREVAPIGIPISEMRHLASELAIPNVIHYDATASKIESIILNGHMAIALIQNGYTRSALTGTHINLHYLLVTGIASDKSGRQYFIVIPDGVNAIPRLLPYEDMDKRLAWKTQGAANISLWAAGMRNQLTFEILNENRKIDTYTRFNCKLSDEC